MKFIVKNSPASILRQIVPTLAVLSVLLAGLNPSGAQTQVFSEDWETDHSTDGAYKTNYTVGGTNSAILYFDYSSVGVPLSPNSTGLGTHALRMAANLDASVQVFPSGVSVSPVGFSITENFDMHFDGWFNFNGPAPAGGNGSTQVGGAGYGTAGTTAQVAGTADSVYIGGTADGGSGADYRVYSPSHQASYQDGDFRIGSDGIAQTTHGDPASGLVYASTGGSRNNTAAPWPTQFPGQSPPAAQTALFPQQTGTAQNGSLGFKWHDVSLQKIANVITYKIDGFLIATVDVTDAGTLGGANILFNHYDINAGASSDTNRTTMAFTLIDNVRITNFPNVVSVTTATPTIAEATPTTPGVFTITRSSSGTPLTVTYTMTGSATNGVDYTNAVGAALSGSVTFASAATSTNINVYAVDDAIPETTESIILNIDPSPNYTGAGNATIRIIDNETPVLTITNLNTQMYERTNDFARFQITRLGATNTPSFPINFSFTGGTATYGSDFYTNVVITFEPGVQTTNISILPIQDGVFEGNETAVVNIAPAGAGEYAIGSPGSASITIVDADSPPETVVFSDNFNTDSSANWSLLFADTNTPSVADSSALFAYDYSGQNIPPAPHGSGDTLGLFLTVNKDATPAGAALNLYPVGQNFSGNFALKFDMFLNIGAGSSSTEYALFGINHSGTKTNWWRSGGIPAGTWSFDGIFYAVETDAQSTPNFQNYSSPLVASNNPAALSPGFNSSAFASAFKSPPFAVAGSPANNVTNTPSTPVWADVELDKVGNVITLQINHTTIFSYTNTTAYTSGNIMLGYEDAFDSIGPVQDYVIYDNVRVVSLNLAALSITSITRVGGNLQIDFAAGASDLAAQFVLQATSTVTGGFADVSSSITSLGGGNFRATLPFNPNSVAAFYRVRRAFF